MTALGAVTVGGRALGGWINEEGGTTLAPSGPTTELLEPAGRMVAGHPTKRVLVVVNLQGGNDGLSTLIPYNDGRYRDLRPALGVVADDALELDADVGLHPSLKRLHRRGIATVEGVGPLAGDLSHFAMAERWERGDVDGTHRPRTGFLGRLTDTLGSALDDAGLVGASLAGSTPHLLNQQATTVALNGTDDLWFLAPPDWAEAQAYQDGLADLRGASAPSGSHLDAIFSGYRELAELGRRLAGLSTELDGESPMMNEGGDLGRQLMVAADLIAADVGVRVIYAQTGDYDTHAGHEYKQAANLSQLDAAIDGFLDLMAERGLANDVLVATVSEFGRRVEEHSGGLDHGAASTMLLAGPVKNGRFGERPSLDDLDEDGNLKVAIGFDRYLATLAEEWLGVEAASVLGNEVTPLGIL